jgi:hypothetical protein
MNGASWHAFWLGELWHPLKGLGYQFWSGIEGALQSAVEHVAYFAVALSTWWHHNNCIERGCWRKGHKDPGHGHPICKKHQDKL